MSSLLQIQTERPNEPAAGKAGIARLLAVEHHCPGLPEPERSASLVESHEGPTDLPLDTATSDIPTYGLRVAPDPRKHQVSHRLLPLSMPPSDSTLPCFVDKYSLAAQ